MADDLRHSDYARTTAICVNLALDAVEGEIRKELAVAGDQSAQSLRRILCQLAKRRIDIDALRPCGTA